MTTIIIALNTIALIALIAVLILSAPISTTLVSIAIAIMIMVTIDMIISKIVTGKVQLAIITIIRDMK